MGGVESSTSTAAFPAGGSKSMISKMINGYKSVIHSSCPFSWSFKWIEFPTLQRHKTKFLLLFKMFENFMHTSPATETGCRINTLSDSGSMIPLTGDNRKKYFQINHKKWELRRLRSLDKVQEIIAGNGRYLKKQRPTSENNDVDCTSKLQIAAAKECWNRKSAVASVWLASSSSNQLVKSDVVLQETSGFSNEENEGKKNMQDSVPCWRSHGSISVIGRRREMEDAVAMELGFLRRGTKEYYDFFGVYDGHGGSRVAQACRDRLHKLVGQVVGEKGDSNINEDGGGGINWDKVMLESFKKMDEEVNRIGTAVATMGSTAVVAVVGEEEVVVANCGDSRAVLSRAGAAIPLSSDHKPERPDELERIELSGGKVIDWNGHRILGVLATSRSIGDNYLKPFVISEPEVTVSRRTDADEFLILASDGLWDVISNDVACHVVRRCLHGQVRRGSRRMASGKKFSESSTTEGRANHEMEGDLAAEASSILAELAIARGSRDNISVIVIQLKRSASLGANRMENFSGTKEEIS